MTIRIEAAASFRDWPNADVHARDRAGPRLRSGQRQQGRSDGVRAAARLDDADIARLKAMRSEIATLEARKTTTAAREVEEKAMLILGYHKAWTACGTGSFLWMKLPSKPS